MSGALARPGPCQCLLFDLGASIRVFRVKRFTAAVPIEFHHEQQLSPPNRIQ